MTGKRGDRIIDPRPVQPFPANGVLLGKIIDAEFGGRNAGDRYCAACEERFPRRSALCPRCGGALTLWATHHAAERLRRRHSSDLGRTALYFAIIAVAIVLVIVLGGLGGQLLG